MLTLGLLALVFASPAAAHVMKRPSDMTLEQTIAFQHKVVKHDLSVIRFFDNHRWMLARYNKYRPAATRELAFHRRQLAVTRKALAANLAKVKARELRQRLRNPRAAICHVFGDHCRQALAVARCESNYSTLARNGQYRGLFQMGRHERATYGHGPTALAQSRAAYRYFVASGRTWGPWECKPWRSWV